MGAMAEAFVAFAQPLIDQTDGSEEEVQRALTISQLCYNLAALPEDDREKSLVEIRQSLGMAEEEFDEFRRSVIVPMIQRHENMFPFRHQRESHRSSQSGPSLLPAQPGKTARGEPYPGTDRYAPCPCGSGEKYKFCCGKKGR
jgi:uncharacterized protein YecA (UPF0149 family)